MTVGSGELPDIVGGIIQLRDQDGAIARIGAVNGQSVILCVGIIFYQRFSCSVVYIDEGIAEGGTQLTDQTAGDNHIAAPHQTVMHLLNQIGVIPCALRQKYCLRVFRVSAAGIEGNAAHTQIVVDVILSSAVKRAVGNRPHRIAQH